MRKEIPKESIPQNELEIRHNCGIAGTYAPGGDVAGITIQMLVTLQPRGHEGAGVHVSNGDQSETIKDEGWARYVFTKKRVKRLRAVRPTVGVGQDRYSTSGGMDAWQPFVEDDLSLVHNGNLTNPRDLLEQLPSSLQEEAISDSWIAHRFILNSPGKTLEQKIQYACGQFEGAFNFIMTHGEKLYAVRDYHGFRPLVIGELPKGGFVVASETAAFSQIGAKLLREVREGEGVVIDESGVKTFFLDKRTSPEKIAHCLFEFVYISSPDSEIFGKSVAEVRYECGRMLARADAKRGFLPDIVVPVQNSGVLAAQGYSEEMVRQVVSDPEKFNIKPEDLADRAASLVTHTGLVANQYAGRVFIAPNGRFIASKEKHRANASDIAGKKVAVIDDSILRSVGARTIKKAMIEHPPLLGKEPPEEIHMRIASPSISWACYYGVDTRPEELIAAKTAGETNEIRKRLGIKTLHYITLRELVTAVVGEEKASKLSDRDLLPETGHCAACFTGHYPTEIEQSSLFEKFAVKQARS